jgi:ABC-2 type transport system ATP-binding protein
MIEIRGMTKKYGKTAVLDGVNATFRNGEIFALIGSNGSGKTTLLKTAAGLYRADAGGVLADGVPVFENSAFKYRSFMLPEEIYFPAQSNLAGAGRYYRGYYPYWDDDFFAKLTALTGLSPEAPLRGFSKGMLRQAGLVLALSARPLHLFLDETFDGLDPGRRRVLSRLLRRYADAADAVIVFTSHYIGETGRMADAAGFIRDGALHPLSAGDGADADAPDDIFAENTEEMLVEVDKLFENESGGA